jgi:hypothetical protein
MQHAEFFELGEHLYASACAINAVPKDTRFDPAFHAGVAA